MSECTPNIKILIACHKDGLAFPNSNCFLPIQTGCALTGKHFSDVAHDDDGENISGKNASYCELTALYWAWKNLEADYYGLMHYRRYFSFTEATYPTNLFGDVLLQCNDEHTSKMLSLDDAHIKEQIEGESLILPEPGRFAGNPTMEEQFRQSWQLYDKDFDILREVVCEISPEMKHSFDEYMLQRKGYFCNMFIMSKELFGQYCEWLFSVLAEHERRSDYSNYDVDKYRISGYLAERLLGVYATYLKNEKGITPKHLQKAFFTDVMHKPENLKCAFPNKLNMPSKKCVTAVMAADEAYVPYLSALLQSIKDSSNKKRNYDLVVLTSDISSSSEKTLKRQIEQENISLRFYNVAPVAKGRLDNLKLRGHFQIETYYRLLMQDIFTDWNKVLYLDSDMIVLKDIAELFDTDVNGYLVAACKDADTAGLYNGYDPGRKEYSDNVLGLSDPFGYFQAGTILFNLEEFRKAYSVDDMIRLAASENWKLLDQDVLNVLAAGCVKYVPMQWNVMTDWRGLRVKRIIRRAPKALYFRSFL